MRTTVRTAALGFALVALAVGVKAEPHEPLAQFFANPPLPAQAARPERRHVRPAAQPAAATAQAFAARRAPASPAKADFVIGIFGDAFAASVARGLTDAEAPDPGRKVVDATGDDAGVATVDAARWEQAIESARKDGGRLDAAVVMVGRSDGVALTDGHGQHQDVGSAAWRQLYGDRVAAVADRFRDRHVPLIWVGLPIVRDPDEAKLYATLNEIVHDRAVHEGAAFVDSWQAFADENGDFSTAGPDVDGRPATLRWSNGWNFTRSGARKLASFVLPDLKRIRDRLKSTQELASVPAANPDSFDQALNIDVNAQILREAGLQAAPPEAVKGADPAVAPKAGAVLMLTAAPVAPGGQLASIDPGTRPAGPDAAESPHAGRADDFGWPRP